MTYNAGELVGYVTNVMCRGYSDGWENCMELTIANAASQGIGGVPPADYPVLKDGPGGCIDASGVVGEWGIVHSITMVVTGCPTGTDQSSWGAIKSLYR